MKIRKYPHATLISYTDAVIHGMSKAVPKAMRDMARHLKNSIKKDITRFRTVPPNFRSKPGQAPFKETGKLAKSIRSRGLKGNMQIGYSAMTYTNNKYARDLEYGRRRRGTYLAPRPHWRPAIQRERPAFQMIANKIFNNMNSSMVSLYKSFGVDDVA